MTDALPDRAPDGPDRGPVPALDVAAVETELDDVARALDRLDDGTYGTCEVCGAVLDDGVLGATPAARRCADHPASGGSG